MLCLNTYGRVVPVAEDTPPSLLAVLGLTPYKEGRGESEGRVQTFTYPVADQAAEELLSLRKEELQSTPFTLIPLYESILHLCGDLQTTEEVMVVVQGVSGFENFDESDALDFLNYLQEKKSKLG